MQIISFEKIGDVSGGDCRSSGSTYPAVICDNAKPNYPDLPGWAQGAIGGAIANARGGPWGGSWSCCRRSFG